MSETNSNSVKADDDGCFNEDRLRPVYGDTNDVDRWSCMINESPNANVGFLHVLKEIKEEIIERIDLFERDLRSRIEMKLIPQSQSLTVFTNANIKVLLTTLGVKFPIQDYESFEAFDRALENDTEKLDALRELLLHQIDFASTAARDVAKLINYVMAESVQINFTWAGKNRKGHQRQNFSLTNVYLCMEDVLVLKYKSSSSSLKLGIKISNHFSSVVFRYKSTKDID